MCKRLALCIALKGIQSDCGAVLGLEVTIWMAFWHREVSSWATMAATLPAGTWRDEDLK